MGLNMTLQSPAALRIGKFKIKVPTDPVTGDTGLLPHFHTLV